MDIHPNHGVEPYATLFADHHVTDHDPVSSLKLRIYWWLMP